MVLHSCSAMEIPTIIALKPVVNFHSRSYRISDELNAYGTLRRKREFTDDQVKPALSLRAFHLLEFIVNDKS